MDSRAVTPYGVFTLRTSEACARSKRFGKYVEKASLQYARFGGKKDDVIAGGHEDYAKAVTIRDGGNEMVACTFRHFHPAMDRVFDAYLKHHRVRKDFEEVEKRHGQGRVPQGLISEFAKNLRAAVREFGDAIRDVKRESTGYKILEMLEKIVNEEKAGLDNYTGGILSAAMASAG
jgi:hypothetical protein